MPTSVPFPISKELDMDGCGEIPVPWKELCMFRWERLRKANFTKSLGQKV